MQLHQGAQRDVAFRYVNTRAQADETRAPRPSVLASDSGIAAEAGNAEAALLQPKEENSSGGGGPGSNPFIGQLYLFGRLVH